MKPCSLTYNAHVWKYDWRHPCKVPGTFDLPATFAAGESWRFILYSKKAITQNGRGNKPFPLFAMRMPENTPSIRHVNAILCKFPGIFGLLRHLPQAKADVRFILIYDKNHNDRLMEKVGVDWDARAVRHILQYCLEQLSECGLVCIAWFKEL